MLIPWSCGWVEILELLLNRPLWPGYKSEQLQQHDPGNTQSTLSFPDGCPLLSRPSIEVSTHPSQPTPAHPCKPAQRVQREDKGEALSSSALFSQSSVQIRQHAQICLWGGNNYLIKQGLNVKWALLSGVILLPDWDKPSQGKAQGTIAVLLF